MTDYYSQRTHGPFHIFAMESFGLEEGGRLLAQRFGVERIAPVCCGSMSAQQT